MAKKRIASLCWSACIFFVTGVAFPACSAPSGFRDSPRPVIRTTEQRVSHTEEIVIGRPIQVVLDAMNKPLRETLRGTNELPGVSGDFMLTKGTFGAPGSRHIVCLTDGGSVEEEALEREETPNSARFKYVVWNYQTLKARPILFGVGEFQSQQIDDSHTRVIWTYSFKLREDVFPGYLGALGRYLFRTAFLDRDYAAMMRGVLTGYKTAAEKQTGAAKSCGEPARLRLSRIVFAIGV